MHPALIKININIKYYSCLEMLIQVEVNIPDAVSKWKRGEYEMLPLRMMILNELPNLDELQQ